MSCQPVLRYKGVSKAATGMVRADASIPVECVVCLLPLGRTYSQRDTRLLDPSFILK
jgi:hypothetical protein